MQTGVALVLFFVVVVLLTSLSNTGMLGYVVNTVGKLDDGCGVLECVETISVLATVNSGLNEAFPGLGTCVDNCERFFCRGPYAVGASNCTMGTGLVENTCPSLNLCAEECAVGCTGGDVSSGECISTDIVDGVCPQP